jgi:predicted DNA-binding transcriptional regulator AlpA
MDAQNINNFCKTHDISRAFFYRLLQEGRGPEIAKLGTKTLITKEAAARWREKISEDVSKAGK